jgi:hypothetical protein
MILINVLENRSEGPEEQKEIKVGVPKRRTRDTEQISEKGNESAGGSFFLRFPGIESQAKGQWL